MFIFLYSDTLLQYGRGGLEVPGQGLVSLQIPGVETAGKPHREETKEPSLIHRVESLVCELPQRCSHRQTAAWLSPLIQIVEVEAVCILVTCHNTVMCFIQTPSVTFTLSWCGQLFFCPIFSVFSACLWDIVWKISLWFYWILICLSSTVVWGFITTIKVLNYWWTMLQNIYGLCWLHGKGNNVLQIIW